MEILLESGTVADGNLTIVMTIRGLELTYLKRSKPAVYWVIS